MVRKVLSLEDGNLQDIGVKYRRDRPYKDIDLAFKPLPGPLDSDGTRLAADIFKKTDAAAVKQALKNIILTNKNEKPFNSSYGAGLNEQLFELNDTDTAEAIEDLIYEAVGAFEPRIKILRIDVRPKLASRLNVQSRDEKFYLDTTNEMLVTVVFAILATTEEVELTVTLTRLR